MIPIEDKYYSVEEYLQLEREIDFKIEYHQGRIYSLAGGSPEHNLISGNVVTALNNALDKQPCLVYNSDQALLIEASQRYVYPDAMVICEEQQFDETRLKLTNPNLIVEVLSNSTKGYDKSGKFHLYSKLPSFKEYLLIHTNRVLVEAYYRQKKDPWRISSAFNLDKKIHLFSLDIDLYLKDIYKKIDNLEEGI